MQETAEPENECKLPILHMCIARSIQFWRQSGFQDLNGTKYSRMDQVKYVEDNL